MGSTVLVWFAPATIAEHRRDSYNIFLTSSPSQRSRISGTWQCLSPQSNSSDDNGTADCLLFGLYNSYRCICPRKALSYDMHKRTGASTCFWSLGALSRDLQPHQYAPPASSLYDGLHSRGSVGSKVKAASTRCCTAASHESNSSNSSSPSSTGTGDPAPRIHSAGILGHGAASGPSSWSSISPGSHSSGSFASSGPSLWKPGEASPPPNSYSSKPWAMYSNAIKFRTRPGETKTSGRLPTNTIPPWYKGKETAATKSSSSTSSSSSNSPARRPFFGPGPSGTKQYARGFEYQRRGILGWASQKAKSAFSCCYTATHHSQNWSPPPSRPSGSDFASSRSSSGFTSSGPSAWPAHFSSTSPSDTANSPLRIGNGTQHDKGKAIKHPSLSSSGSSSGRIPTLGAGPSGTKHRRQGSLTHAQTRRGLKKWVKNAINGCFTSEPPTPPAHSSPASSVHGPSSGSWKTGSPPNSSGFSSSGPSRTGLFFASPTPSLSPGRPSQPRPVAQPRPLRIGSSSVPHRPPVAIAHPPLSKSAPAQSNSKKIGTASPPSPYCSSSSSSSSSSSASGAGPSGTKHSPRAYIIARGKCH
ncbi:unnamed protein product [Sympodiomycopsis kandeliae]